ncbi:Hypp5886 [Branchiostoma lanceolatum]|uniref:Hypp5886 protein n=1 Tax=Branchiostoma lanceolatum TaxID=7740 RepID=A0A8J9YS03_BRALA|nr:Hypp5886 [Branchiostoma lanceolatum]
MRHQNNVFLQNWIKNYRANKRKKQMEASGEGGEPEKKQKVTKKKTTPYLRFLSHHLKGKSGKPDFKAAGVEYRRTQTANPDLFTQFVKEAEETPTVSLQDLGTTDKQREAKRMFRTVSDTMTDIQTCGWEGFAVVYDPNTSSFRACGTAKGVDYLNNNRAIPVKFASAIAGHTCVERKVDPETLRKKVREMMNKKWNAAGGKRAFSYAALTNRKVTVEGIPVGVTLKNPCGLGPGHLKIILEHRDDIVVKFPEGTSAEVLEGEGGASAEAEGGAPAEVEGGAPAEVEGGASVAQMLSGVVQGLQQAAMENTGEVSLQLDKRGGDVETSRKGIRGRADKGNRKKKGNKNLPSKVNKKKPKGKKKHKLPSNHFDAEDDLPLNSL